jgi:hypothetical protein
MTEVCKNLFVFNQQEYNDTDFKDDEWSFCFAAKSFHKVIAKPDGAEQEGYVGNLSPSQKEYLVAYRPERHTMALNLIDADDPGYIPEKAIKVCLVFVHSELKKGRKVALVCNKGKSRSPSIALMYLCKYTDYFKGCVEPSEYFDKFREACPKYDPRNGMLEFTENFIIFG